MMEDGTTVMVQDPEGVLPSGVRIRAKEIDPQKETTKADRKTAEEERSDAARKIKKEFDAKYGQKDLNITEFRLYEICLEDEEGHIVTPQKELEVTIGYLEGLQFNSFDRDASGIRVALIDEKGNVSLEKQMQLRLYQDNSVEEITFRTKNFFRTVVMDTEESDVETQAAETEIADEIVEIETEEVTEKVLRLCRRQKPRK